MFPWFSGPVNNITELCFPSIKLGVIEDHSNRTRLAKLLRFLSSNSEDKYTSLADYVGRMKEKQDTIYFMAGTSRKEVENSPFVERLLKKGYEVLYLVEPIDEYCIQVCFAIACLSFVTFLLQAKDFNISINNVQQETFPLKAGPAFHLT